MTTVLALSTLAAAATRLPSIDIYSNSVRPRNIGYFPSGRTPGAPSRLGSSYFITSSSFKGRHAPEQQLKSSHSLLPPPPARSHSGRLRDDQKLASTASSQQVSTPRRCSFTQAVLNGINVLCGVGILSTPYAVKEGGWTGLLVLVLFAALAWYTGVLLCRCLDSEPGLETYPDIGQAAFGTMGRLIVSIVLYLELYACCVEYIILESDNLSSLFPGAHLNILGVHLDSHLLFAVLTTLIALPTTWLRDLSLLSYISAGGVVASVLVAFCLFWVGALDGVGFEQTNVPLLNLSSFPIAVGLYGYCYSGHGVFPNIYSSLEKPSQFPSVLFTCFGICTVLFGGVAVMGYLMFGDSIESQFTLNLPHEFVASKVAVWTTVVNPITKFALTLTPVALSLEELIPSNYIKTDMYAIAIRSSLTISVLLVALSIPFFGLVMSLVGSFLTMLMTFIFPCACFLSIVRGKVSWPEGMLCGFIIVVGAASCAMGTISSLSGIAEKLH